MTDIIIPRDKDLAFINAQIKNSEEAAGPLKSMAYGDTGTKLNFDDAAPNPTSFAVVAADVAGVPAIPAGATQVCRGVIYIAGVLTPATASRP